MIRQRGLTTALAVTVALAFTWAHPGLIEAQQAGTVEGTVVDAETGEPLRGVQISIAGTQRGTLTGADGGFRITGVPAGAQEVRAQFLGYGTRSQTAAVGAGETVSIDFELRRTVLDVGEIVVIGVAGETTRGKLPFSVTRLSAAEFSVAAPTAASAIQGKAAGVTVVQGSGRPGSAPSILLRGPTSIHAEGRSQEPLFIVDGVILGASLVDLDALDIEDIQIVKGAAAASLYGSRAAHGVVQVTTARGQGVADDQVRYTLRSEFGHSDLQRTFDLTRRHQFLMNGDGTRFLDGEGRECSFMECSSVQLAGQRAAAGQPANDWNTFQIEEYPETFDNIGRFFDPGNTFQTSLAVDGRSGGTNYRVSFSNLREEGVLPGQAGFDRYNFRVNLDQSIADDFQLSTTAFVSRSSQDQFTESSGNPLFDLTRMPAGVDIAATDEDGELFIQPDPFNENANPLYSMLNREWEEERQRSMASANLRYSPTGWMSLDANVSYDRLNEEWSDFYKRGFRTARPSAVNDGHVYKFNAQNEALNASAMATFTRTMGDDLATRTQLRYLYEEQERSTQTGWGYELATDGVRSLSALGAPDRRRIRSSLTSVRAEGYFLSTYLDYRDRYIVDALVRRDGSSLFGPDERWHIYYRLAGAWRISEEGFFNLPGVNELKIRYSYGTAGGRPTFAAQYETFSVTDGVVTPRTLGNRNLKPEFAAEQELGLELVLHDRFSVDLTYSHLNAEDQILNVPLPAFTGFSSQWMNAGTLRGNTLEATLDAAFVERPGFRWSGRIMFDRTRQRIAELDVPPWTYGVDPDAHQQMGDVFYAAEGVPLGTFYGPAFAESCEHLPSEVRAHCGTHFEVNDDGLLVFVGEGNTWRSMMWGQTGEVAGESFLWGAPIVYDEFTPTGKTTPDFNLRFSNTVDWGNFSFYGLVDSSQGLEVWNQPLQWACFQSYCGIMDQTGKPEAERKPVGYYGPVTGLYHRLAPNSYFVQDASFVKLRELSVRYRVPEDQLSQVPFLTRASDLILSVQGRNLYTWTDYNGYDPEVGLTGGDTGSAALARMDGFNYPNFRTFTFGVQVSF